MDPDGLRVGSGFDSHRTVVGRPLMLGGVEIEGAPFGLDGHSDADVLLHAVTDALLGAAGLGDIGEWFPDSQAQWKDADSGQLLQGVLAAIRERGWRIINLDCTIHAEQPKLTPWKPLIRRRLAELLNMADDRICVKAKSGERVGPVGRGESLQAEAVVLLAKAAAATSG